MFTMGPLNIPPVAFSLTAKLVSESHRSVMQGPRYAVMCLSGCLFVKCPWQWGIRMFVLVVRSMNDVGRVDVMMVE